MLDGMAEESDELSVARTLIGEEAKQRIGRLNLGGLGLTRVPPELRHLRGLDLGNTPLSDLAPLAGPATLQVLNCSGTRVSDLAPLAGLAALQRLDCCGCRLRALPPTIMDKPSLNELIRYEGHVPGLPSQILSQLPIDNCIGAVRAHSKMCLHPVRLTTAMARKSRTRIQCLKNHQAAIKYFSPTEAKASS